MKNWRAFEGGGGEREGGEGGGESGSPLRLSGVASEMRERSDDDGEGRGSAGAGSARPDRE